MLFTIITPRAEQYFADPLRALSYITDEDGELIDVTGWSCDGISGADTQSLSDYCHLLLTKAQATAAARREIEQTAGDTLSILGTTADATQLLVYGLAQIVRGLSTANSLAEVRAAVEPFTELSIGFLDRVESGEVKLPFLAKGLDSVITDVESRATAVAVALANASQG